MALAQDMDKEKEKCNVIEATAKKKHFKERTINPCQTFQRVFVIGEEK